MSYNSDYEVRLATLGAMGGDVTKNYNSVYEIDLEILKLTEQGGGNASAIESVDVLPDAGENKNKLYRLNSDDNVYVSELKSRTTITTNKLPDDEQIDKAYILNAGEVMGYYKGSFKLICIDGEINCYGWGYEYIPDEESEEVTIIDTFTFDNAENCTPDTILFYIDSGEWTFEGNVATTDIYTVSDMEKNYYTISEDGGVVIPATYNAPEANQIGNAWIDFDSDVCYYTGVERETEIEGKDVTLYQWKASGVTIYTSKKPHNMYYQNADDGEGNKSVMCDWITYNSDISEETSLQREVHIVALNAPDSEQMDNAYLEMETHYKGNGKFYYKGEIQIREYNGETVSSDYVIGHLWETEDKYHQYVTLTNAQNVYGGNIGGHFPDEDLQDYGDEIGWASTTYTLAEIPELISYYDTDYIISQLPSTVKYQRTEPIEEWDWVKVATEQYVNDAIDEIPQLEAGQNIEIVDNKINALGYSFNGRSFTEIPLVRTDAIQEFPYPLEQLGLNDLQLTGDAGATTYTMGGTSAVVMAQMGTQMIQMGVMMKTANSEIAKITSIDTTNSTITFESTLDANNALSNEVVTNLYIPEIILISGAAGATTYTYTSQMPLPFGVGDTVSFGDYPLVKVIGEDTSNNTITFDRTLDENDSVSNAQFKYSFSKNNTSSGWGSHAEGGNTTASGNYSHAEGNDTTASGNYSHAEGNETTASGEDSHAEGSSTNASGVTSHAEGSSTIAQNYCEHAEGRCNTSHKASEIYGNSGNTQHSVGIGTGSTSQYRKNAVEVMQNGDMYVYGIGGYVGTNTKVQDVSIKTLQEYIASLDSRLTALGG